MTANIHPFSDYILRNPAFPISAYLNVLENYSEQKLLACYHDDYLKEAIRIASPVLKASLDAWQLDPSQYSAEKKEAMAISFMKYLARIATRCTPFGLFAGCDVGSISDESKIILLPKEEFTRLTQFDMHFWIAMLLDFAQRKEVRSHLQFYPNNSIYPQGDFLRYIEYKYVETKREHLISAVAQTELLTELLAKAQNGMTIAEMLDLLADDASETEAALEYIHQLIDFQLLVSELDARITGSDEWERVLTILAKIPSLQTEADLLIQCRKQLQLLDRQFLPGETDYQTIKALVAGIGCPYEDKFLFQTDLNTRTTSNSLHKKIVDKTKQALYFLNGIRQQQPLPNLSDFTKAFLHRYETREMPLTTVLDTETGIGYAQNTDRNDSHPLLDALPFRKNSSYSYAGNWSANDFILEKKLQQTLAENRTEMTLNERDFPDFNGDWEHCPVTFSVLIEVLKKGGTEQVFLASSGGVSAAKLPARFCNVHPKIYDHTKMIIEKETAYHSDKILAEIAHIPQSRTGNILRRPVLREYEIPYLSNSGVGSDFQIPVSDLMVSIKNNSIVLRSKKLNKTVIPCLSNAHNYSNNALPIYQFLCDMQVQNLKPIYSFDWGVLWPHYAFFPRVVYKDVILSKAKWQLIDTEMAHLHKLSGNALRQAFADWREQKKLPRFVNWADTDHTLLFDLDQEMGIMLLLKSTKKYPKITLEEFLFDHHAMVQDANGAAYTNQIILSFFKQ
jgi:lantibiotic biosynthesis protein